MRLHKARAAGFPRRAIVEGEIIFQLAGEDYFPTPDTQKENVKTAQKMGEMFYLEHEYEKAIPYLKPLLGHADIDQNFLRVHLSEIYAMTKNHAEFSEVLLGVSYDKLKHLKRFPPAMSRTDRDKLFRELRADLQQAYDTVVRRAARRRAALDAAATAAGGGGAAASSSSASTTATTTRGKRAEKEKGRTTSTIVSDAKRRKTSGGTAAGSSAHGWAGEEEDDELPRLSHLFVPRFVHLVYDCELDYERAMQSKSLSGGGPAVERVSSARSSRSAKSSLSDKNGEKLVVGTKSTGPSKARIKVFDHKRKLALESIEDIYGSLIWFDFVRFGCQFGLADLCGETETAVELLEIVYYSRKTFVLPVCLGGTVVVPGDRRGTIITALLSIVCQVK